MAKLKNLQNTNHDKYFRKNNLTAQQIDEMYSGQPFAISRYFFGIKFDLLTQTFSNDDIDILDLDLGRVWDKLWKSLGDSLEKLFLWSCRRRCRGNF